MDFILMWLGQKESAISAIAGIAAILAFIVASVKLIFFNSDIEPVQQDELKARDASIPIADDLMESVTLGILHVNHAENDVRDDEWARELGDDLVTYLASASLFEIVVPPENLISKSDQIASLKSQGASLILQTSVRPSGLQVKVNAILIELRGGQHIWSQNYKRLLSEPVSSGDDVAHLISTQIAIPIIENEVTYYLTLSPDQLNGARLTRLGYHSFVLRGRDPRMFAESKELLDKAIVIAPDNAHAHAVRALCYSTSVIFGFSDDAENDYKIANRDTKIAMRLAPTDSLVLSSKGWTTAFSTGFSHGVPFLKRSVDTDPSNAHMRADYGNILALVGRIEEARHHVEEAFRLSPFDPRHYIWEYFLAFIATAEGDFEKTLDHLNASLNFNSYIPSHIGKVTVLVRLNRIEEAQAKMIEIAKIFHPYYQKENFLDHIARFVPEPEIVKKLKEIAEFWPEISNTETTTSSKH
ncbi:MAG: TolB-like protein/tetratricopeptide (TPR) repeat protein [Candidatus Azotimanducaceae bacterium]|jgi:TolB-like protein/tetratricopeptide (TPR) repeat protein